MLVAAILDRADAAEIAAAIHPPQEPGILDAIDAAGYELAGLHITLQMAGERISRRHNESNI